MRTPARKQAQRRRGWRVLIPRHGTIVAYTALVLAMGGTAAAATGATLLLGHGNTARATSGLTNSGKSPALSLKTSAKYAPLSVSSKRLVSNLNVSYLGGVAGSGLGSAQSSSMPVAAAACHNGLPCTLELWSPVSGISQGFGAPFAADTLTPDVALVARDLTVSITSAPPDAGDSITVFLGVNDVNTTFACQVANGSVSCADTTGTVRIPAGSRISLEIESTISPGSSLPLESVDIALRLGPA
jgi:hypothetical protein